MTAPTLRSVLRRITDVLGTLVGWVVLCLLAVFIIPAATQLHWILGIVVTAACAVAAFFGLADLRSHAARGFPVRKGLLIFVLTGLTGIAVAASVSLQLLRVGWAVYEPVPLENDAHRSLTTYYVWVFLDMLPAVKATELLAFLPPLKPTNSVAGLPVMAFRAFVFLGLLAALRVWWQGRKQDARLIRPNHQ